MAGSRGLSQPVRASHAVRALQALVLTAGLFGFVLVVLVPGYWINDDVKISWLLSGYPGGAPSPFAVHSNVLVGLALLPLFKLVGSLNWFSISLTGLNAISTGVLLYLALTRLQQQLSRLIGSVLVLAGMALFILEISYTISAFMACLAGVCVLGARDERGAASRVEFLAGVAMIVLGSLVRMEMLAAALFIAAPPIFLSIVQPRRIILGLVAACIVALGAYGVGRLYTRAQPEWNAFIAYTRIRQNIHDSHRLANVHGQIRRVGWTPNDQELFARWFYPDEQLYSYEHLRYLEANVSPLTQDVPSTLSNWFTGIPEGRNLPYLILMLGLVLSALALKVRMRALITLSGPLLLALGLNAAFALVYKNPDYVQACTVAACILMAPILVGADLERRLTRSSAGARRLPDERVVLAAGAAVAAAGVILLFISILSISRINDLRRQAYVGIRADLAALASTSVIPSGSLLISPAHGIPYEWSNPFLLDTPVPTYLDTGWITFSPSYRATLADFGITSIPEALITRADVLLLTQRDFMPFLIRFYEEHDQVPIESVPLYAMPNSGHWAGYDDIYLFRLHLRE